MPGIQGQNLGNQNAFGNLGGKSLNDRKLAAEVRTLVLKKIKQLLEIPDCERSVEEFELYRAVLIKLAGSILPRLNEVTGEDGEGLTITIAPEIAEKNGIVAMS
ncbi:MAG: hypothetical protein WC848_02490 [Parcubacteria group bacterium]|jgi:hypothetical protein